MPVVTCAALVSTLKAATVALAIAVTGPCIPYFQINAAPAGSVLDFTHATGTSRIDIGAVNGVTIRGFASTNTQYGALNLRNASNIVLDGVRCDGDGTACMTLGTSDHVEVKNFAIVRTHGDGIDVAGSTNVSIHDGSCRNNVVTALHPDCVQMWSLVGHPVQHVVVQHVTVYGATQGIDNFGAIQVPGETDIKVLDNTLAVTASNCIALVGVSKAVVTGNRCTTLFGAQWAALVKVFCPTDAAKYGPCLDAVVSDNVNGGPPPKAASPVAPNKAP